MRNLLSTATVRFRRFRRVHLPRHIRKAKQLRHHPSFKIPAMTVAVLLVLTVLSILVAHHTKHLMPVKDAKIVIISHDHTQQIVPSKEATVGALLKKLHLSLEQGDVVEPSQTSVIDQDQFRINIYRAVPVQIVDGGTRTYVFSAAKTPRAIAQQAGVSVYAEDDLNTDPAKNFLAEGSVGKRLVIDRATPIDVDLYGTEVTLRTQAKTVGELIKEKHIKIIKNDQIVPSADTPLSATQHVSLIRTGTKVETVTEDVAMPLQTISDPSLAYGTSAVRQQGSAGQQIVTYQVDLVNNVVTNRTAIQKVVTKAAVTQVVVMGTSLSGIKGDMALAGIAPGDYQYADYIISHESGWCPTKAQGQYGGCPAYSGSVPSYGGYGLCQSTPGSKMASAGADWATNPITQLKWCSNYASRYGGWAGAYNHWLSSHNW